MKPIKFFYDLETTGVNYKQNAIIQLGAKIEINDKVVEEIDLLIQPHPKAIIEPEALQVNGRTLEEIKNFPYNYETAYKELIRILSKYVDRFKRTEKMYLVGFNNKSFDDFFFRKLFELNNDSFFNSWFWSESIDAQTIAGQYLIGRRPYMTNFKLKTVAHEMGIEIDESRLHEAGYDIELTRMIYLISTGRMKEPAQNFHFYEHEGSGTIWKTFEPEIDLKPDVDEIDFRTFRKRLRDMGLIDGPGLIQDELM